MKRETASRWILFSSMAIAASLAISCARQQLPPPWILDANGPASFANEYYPSLAGNVRALRSGDPEKPRVIYVHGTPGDCGAWMEFVEYPVEGFEAVSIDRPGFGSSSPGRSTTSLREQARALEPLLVEREGQWPILVGHSLGGSVVARAAADYPGRVGGLVIVAGSLDPDLEEIMWIQYLGAAAPVRWFVPRVLRHTNEEVFALEGELETLHELLPRVTCPVIVIHGTSDGLVPFANVDYMKRAFPEGTIREVVALEGANHFLPWNRAGEIRGAIARLGALQENSIRSQGSEPPSPSNAGEALQTPGTSQANFAMSNTTGR